MVVIEEAGSPAEINLRGGDIVNMAVALHARSPVLLVGDIDKGGVFASLYGTMMLISPEERALVAGTVINKFRGDVSLLDSGLSQLEDLTGVPVLGVVPYFCDIHVPEEDSPSVKGVEGVEGALLDLAVIALPHISNFDDFDPFEREAVVGLRYVRTLDELGAPDLVVLPGTKTTMADLDALRESGLADVVVLLAQAGTAVVGICGGFQMLGRRILDPGRVESDRGEAAGLDLLPVVTTFDERKETRQVLGRVEADYGMLEGCRGVEFTGYEIHMGRSEGGGEPLLLDGGESQRGDGALSTDGWVLGTYVHGLFLNDGLRRGMLRRIAGRKGVALPSGGAEFDQGAEYDKLAAHFRESLDMDAVYGAMGLRV